MTCLIEELQSVINYRLHHNKCITNSCSHKSHKFVLSFDSFNQFDITKYVENLIPNYLKSNEFKAYAIECAKCKKWRHVRLQGLNCQYLEQIHIKGIRIDVNCQHHENIRCEYKFIKCFNEYMCLNVLFRIKLVCHCCHQTLVKDDVYCIHLSYPRNYSVSDKLANIIEEQILKLLSNYELVQVHNHIIFCNGFITNKYWIKYMTNNGNLLKDEYANLLQQILNTPSIKNIIQTRQINNENFEIINIFM